MSRRAVLRAVQDTLLESRLLLAGDTTSILLAASAPSTVHGANLTLTATVSDSTATATTPTGGTVTFLDGATTLGTGTLTNGTATFFTTTLAAGKHNLTASYAGSGSFAASQSGVAPSSTISTIAGDNSAGYSGDGGQATAAQMSGSTGVATDAAGDLYIANYSNNVVRKVTPGGVISTVAGTGTAGYTGDGGQASAAELNEPFGMAVDASGNLYIADYANNAVRKVTPGGVISTVAGTGTAGYTGDGGQATAAQLNDPVGIAFDAAGNLYIADSYNYVVRKVTPGGVISTVAGTGTVGDTGDGGQATAAALNVPASVAFDAAGNLYIADSSNNAVRKVTPGGVISTVAGTGTAGYTGDGGQASAAELSGPFGVAVDASGNLYIGDRDNSVVRMVTPAGLISTLAGTHTFGDIGDGGAASAAKLGEPFGVAIDAAGNLDIGDQGEDVVRQVKAGVPVTVAASGPASSLTVTGAVNETAGGVEVVTVTAYDTYGNIVTGYTGTVHLTSTDGQAVIPADATLTNGVGTFNVTLKTAGTESITATDTTTSSITGVDSGIVVTPAATTHLNVTGAGNETAGGAETVTVTALDAYGNVATGYTGTVHITSSDGQAVLPADATLANGTGTFSVTLRTAGTEAITATDTTSLPTTGTEAGIVVTAAAASRLGMTGAVNETAGGIETVTVTAYDTYGNVATGYAGTIHLTSSDTQAVLPASAALTSGSGTFAVTLKTAGSESITATDTTTPALSANQSGIVVTPAAAASLTMTGATGETAGGTETVTITAFDAYGNIATGDSGTVNLGTTDSQAVLPATLTLSSGVGSFSVVFKTAGSQAISAVDSVNASLKAGETGLVITPAAVAQLVMTGAVNETAGAVEHLTVTAYDAYGNVATGYTGTEHISSSDALATLSPDSALVNGVGLFNVTLRTEGTESITATDTTTPALSASQSGIVVTPASAAKLTITGAVDETAGGAETVTITSFDQYGNIATGYTGTVHITSSDGQAVLPADATLTSGIGTFDVTLKTAGTESIAATDTTTPSLTASQTGLVVTPAAVAKLAMTGAGDETAGGVEHLTVTAFDAYGNVATGYTGTIHLTSSDGQAVLPADATLTSGIGAFDVTLKTAGTESIRVSDTTTPSLTASETGLVVTPAAASKLVLTGGSDETAGGVEHLTITASDAYGNVATGYTGTLHLSSTDAQATLPADSTLTKGVGAFDVTLKTAGTESITATDTVDPTLTVSDSAIVVTPAAATQLVLTGLSDEAAGGVETVTVTAFDAYGNVATGYAGTVNLTSSDLHATYPATVTPTAGVAQFTFKPVTVGAQTLSVADSAAATVAGSATVAVAPAAATSLVVTGAAGGTAGTVERVTITALDAYGNIATGYTGTLHLSSSDLKATLPGDFTLTAGTATVPVTLVTAGTDSITATDTQAASLTGSATGIVVTPATTTRFVIAGPATTIAGQSQTYTVTATDAYGNLTPNDSGTVHVTSSDLAAVLPADTALSAGAGSFAVTLESAGSQTITATDPASGATGSLAGVTTTAMIQGTVYLDLNGNGTLDAGETGLAGRVVYLDLNHSGTFATSDPTATTDAQGHFSFPGVAAGSVPVVEATTQDATDRSVIDQTATAPDGSLTIGAVPFSPLNPILILPTSAASTGGDATSRYVQSLYQAVLGRVGAADEVAGWVALMAKGTTAQQVATSFVDSLEHRTDEVAAFYSSFLHRATDPAAEGWVAELMSGASEATVAEGILDSPEYQSAHADSTLLVRDLYLDVLGRQASTGEVAAWQSALAAGGTPQQVVSSLVQSPEANDQIVESLYVADLHRPREAGTSNVWTAMLSASDSAAAVAADILSSPEFQRNA